MAIPKTVRHWFWLREEYERRLKTEPDPQPASYPS